ncbi:MAG: pre-16S rRNA-processing nuclease YqgF [Cyanobacteria bacterium]|nr:pre-16S rRNA-processing nuclease YqgF [Cyanobacteria bacterium CG_2015-16_32_12]NCO76856.1 pre-16S rRNA-processing nuclease YqgF [Cyanobacteria bacterium CG_2015-22_32_23]NCQ03292.1 pre-16S rRNA-processing nuclease YqgF [Cyanobacteria bacterium CG_2015-09_32_10]NCQ42651.1 pre-16S rRNA-processing nuclease YqgF [Cyanobacteria bacterium CG_2015-04_32_10]NCS84343.1 pre-16S rRNA-processing nuclease YqgF [Cyanobacteria bacterium CG_2015-02_32_10]
MILGFDPGRDKCGVAVLDINKKILYNKVVDSDKAIALIDELIKKYNPLKIVMGNQTTSKQWEQRLKDNLNLYINLQLVDERNSTVEARQKYWEMYPPKGLTRLIPKGLRIPPRPVDDIVAIILIERYLNKNDQ